MLLTHLAIRPSVKSALGRRKSRARARARRVPREIRVGQCNTIPIVIHTKSQDLRAVRQHVRAYDTTAAGLRTPTMPEAIATTKRKFYRALDSLNNPPATRPAEPAAKRARRSISTTSTISRATAQHSDAKKSDATPKPPPNFSPWSHETFLARLKTFSSVSLWHPKPDAISEVEWAKRGWVCVGVNTVACRGGCEKRVVVSLDLTRQLSGEGSDGAGDGGEEVDEAGSESAMEDALVERYQRLIVDGHAQTCLWHKAGCKDDIYHLQVVRPSVWQPELKKRYHLLRQIDDATRDIKVKSLPHDTSASLPPERLLAEMPSDMLGPNDHSPSSESSVRALEIALHGWRGSQDSGNELLHCDACFQRVGLWMYQPDYKPSRTSSDDDAEEDSATVDLVELHRDHCPWRNSITQKASGSLSGLNASQILQRVISTYAREQRRKSDELQKSAQELEADDQGEEENGRPVSPPPSREEVVRQDTERESRLRKLKSLFTIKRKSAAKPAAITSKITR